MDRRDLLMRLNIRQAVESLGIQVKHEGAHWLDCCCPFHEDSNPSFRVAVEFAAGKREHEKGFWICNAGCGSGSIFDLFIRLGRAANFLEAVKLLGLDGEVPERRAPPDTGRRPAAAPPPASKPPQALPASCSVPAHEGIFAYLLQERGILWADELSHALSIVEYRTGKFALAIEKRLNNEVKQIRYLPWPRPDRNSKQLRFWMAKNSQNCLFPDPIGLARESTVIVVESELDAIMLLTRGVLAVASGGTSGMQYSVLKPLLDLHCDVVLMPDADKAGQEALAKALESISRMGHEVRFIDATVMRGSPAPDAKDVGEIGQAIGFDPAVRWVKHAIQNLAKKQTEDPRAALFKRLYLDKDGYPIRNMQNLYTILNQDPVFAGKLWLNEMGGVEYFGDRPIRNTDYVHFAMSIEKAWELRWSKEDLRDAVSAVCASRSRHPVREYLCGLTWDGVPRIAGLIGSIIDLEPGENLELKREYLRRWMVGAVARVMNPGCKMDSMLVLYSQHQGVGKSMLARCLAGEAWFFDEGMDPANRDYVLTLHEHWIVEVSELDASTRKKDQAELRAFLSRTVDKPTRKYQPKADSLPRSFAFIGTTNDRVVVRESDGRRYWPISVTQIRHTEITPEIRDQLWAEAKALYDAGEEWWLPPEAERVRSEDTEERYQGVNLTKEMLPEFLMSMRGWAISNSSSLPSEAWNSRNGFQVSRYIDWLKDKGLVHLFSLPAFTQTMNDLGWRYKVWRINYMGESRSFKAWYPPEGFKLES